MRNVEEPPYRIVCERCWRPKVVCYCRFVTELHTQTRVLILQHPRERDVPINTARIASLCLPDARLMTGLAWSQNAELARALSDPSRPAALLYPGASAIDVEANPPACPITLVVVDGTWWQAKKLVAANPQIAALPRYAFRPHTPSNYRIRKEPKDDYVSTIEALAHVLGVLEKDPARFQAMLDPFRAMVDAQISYIESGVGGRRHVRPKRAQKNARDRIPPILRTRAADLVCVHGEANVWPYKSEERTTQTPEIVQWTAVRVATGQTFDAILRSNAPLAPDTPDHTGLARERLDEGLPRAEAQAAWAAFLRPTDVVCTWGKYAPGVFMREGGTLGDARVDLRVASRLYTQAKVRSIEETLEKLMAERDASSTAERDVAPLANVRGRAARRLAELVAIARALSG